ncbi:Os03g0836600 [Oryza sativa Japonica Group]|uniref:Os03g0836600 protein n=1 Tax=Oryza sativa subsp. japonica TaxID=39947 RepID=C7J019_ORYSJ|nr:Os03g0836600 [Oryza sativa Japonica Group]|eukprot:NP_001173705.1 Os03g0836600 [Oryza sativa Japonica Group]
MNFPFYNLQVRFSLSWLGVHSMLLMRYCTNVMDHNLRYYKNIMDHNLRDTTRNI